MSVRADREHALRLRRELSEVVLVERATGVLMQSHGCSAEAARARLVRGAAAARRSLAEHSALALAAASGNDERQSTAAHPFHRLLVTGDPEEMCAHLGAAHGTRVRLSRPATALAPEARFRLASTDTGLFLRCDDHLPGDLWFDSDPVGHLVVAELLGGRVERQGPDGEDRLGAGEVFLAGRPAAPHSARTVDAHLRTVALPLPLLHRVGGPLPGGREPLRFTSLRPAGPALARQWSAAAGFVARLIDQDEAPPPSLLTSQAANLLAATALAVFPNTVQARPDGGADLADAVPVTVRRATRYLEEHAHQDLTVGDIAEAVHVTPRALQYAFRRHLDVTPLGRLREIRLGRAHEELLAADAGSETVARIAAHWGFLHPGRFAALYRRAYQCSPGDTLRA